ncbi:hypothetical protein V4S33_06595 [Enterococcus cecorum]
MRVSTTDLKTKEGRRKFYNSVEWRALRDERKMLGPLRVSVVRKRRLRKCG